MNTSETETRATAADHDAANKRLQTLGTGRHPNPNTAKLAALDNGYTVRSTLFGDDVAMDPIYGPSATLHETGPGEWVWRSTRNECAWSRCTHNR